jgi:hypothetical protein
MVMGGMQRQLRQAKTVSVWWRMGRFHQHTRKIGGWREKDGKGSFHQRPMTESKEM